MAIAAIGMLWFGAPATATERNSEVFPAPLVAFLSPENEYQNGRLYDRGERVPQDFAIAAYWFRHAAERGYAPAELALARYYARGRGLPKDLILAYLWANWATARLPHGTSEGDAALTFRDYIRFKLTAKELAVAQQWSSGWPAAPSVVYP